MQDKDTEAINNQRKRRKRIGRIRNGIIMTIAGWIILSMILIIVLFVQVIKIQHKLDNIVTVSSKEQVQQENAQKPESAGESVYTDVTEATETPKTYESVTPPATGISEEENLAGDGDIHKVYLTFEDGPSDHTGEILDILAQYDVKATFFVVGKEDEESQALYQRIADEGHTLGMHSYSNKYSQIYQSDEAFEEDFERLRDELYQVTGVNSIYYRFPGGSSNQISNVPMSDFIHYLNEQGVIYYDWNVSAGDAASNAYSSREKETLSPSSNNIARRRSMGMTIRPNSSNFRMWPVSHIIAPSPCGSDEKRIARRSEKVNKNDYFLEYK